MQRKAYVPGVAVLLAALLAGCTGGSSDDGATDDSKPGGSSSTAPAAQPGKYRTLPEACAAVDHGTLDSLLPGIKQISDEDQRETAYEGTPTLTYDTDRRVGCRWKVESTDATDHLFVDFERVVSYDSVSDDGKASGLYTDKETAADLPEPSPPQARRVRRVRKFRTPTVPRPRRTPPPAARARPLLRRPPPPTPPRPP